MKKVLSLIAGFSALALSATVAAADVVCNDEGDCWHVKEKREYPPEVKLHVYSDDWKWSDHDKYRWREHEGHGYWRNGIWIDLH
jgi:hypothetical protein